MSSQPFCLAPWTMLHILPDGNLKPCSVYHGEVGHIQSTPLENSSAPWRQLRKDLQSDFADLCGKCRSEETINGGSIRHQVHQVVSDNNVVVDTSLEAPFDILNLDVSFSSQCNLSCRFCASRFSTHWIPESLALEKKGFDFSNHKDMTDRHRFSIPAKDVIALVERSPNLVKVHLKGGEPLIQNQSYELIRYLQEKGRDKKITLSIVSNTTVIREELRELLTGFHEVDFNVSAEAVGTAYQYVRGGRYKLETDVLNSIRKLDGLPNLKWTFHSVISAYNVFEPIKFHSWLQNLELKSRHKWQFGFLYFPSYLRPGILPKETLEAALTANQGLPEPFRERLQRHLSWDSATDEKKKADLAQLKEFTRLTDEYRKMPIAEFIPELKSVFYT